MTSIDTILAIYFNKQWALVFIHIMYINICHIYIGISEPKSQDNNILYKHTKKKRILNDFGSKDALCSSIEIYGPIFRSEYVYVIYFSEKNGGSPTLSF